MRLLFSREEGDWPLVTREPRNSPRYGAGETEETAGALPYYQHCSCQYDRCRDIIYLKRQMPKRKTYNQSKTLFYKGLYITWAGIIATPLLLYLQLE